MARVPCMEEIMKTTFLICPVHGAEPKDTENGLAVV
jgi:hypothetical protein